MLAHAGILIWWCCRRRNSSSKEGIKAFKPPKARGLVTGMASAASSAAAGAFFWRRTPVPKNLVASKAVDLTPAMVDPEEPPSATPSFTTDPKLGSFQGLDYPSDGSVTLYSHSPLADPTVDTTAAAAAAVAVAAAASKPAAPAGQLPAASGLQRVSAQKGGLPHNDSAASLPSNASSAQGPGTPVAPSATGGSSGRTILATAIVTVISLSPGLPLLRLAMVFNCLAGVSGCALCLLSAFVCRALASKHKCALSRSTLS